MKLFLDVKYEISNKVLASRYFSIQNNEGRQCMRNKERQTHTEDLSGKYSDERMEHVEKFSIFIWKGPDATLDSACTFDGEKSSRPDTGNRFGR